MSDLTETAKKVVEQSSDEELAGIIVSLGRYAFSEKRKGEIESQLVKIWKSAFYSIRTWMMFLFAVSGIQFSVYYWNTSSDPYLVELTVICTFLGNLIHAFFMLAEKILFDEGTLDD